MGVVSFLGCKPPSDSGRALRLILYCGRVGVNLTRLQCVSPYHKGMDARSLGILFIVVGIVVVLIGGAIAVGALSWFGRLPGDIRHEGDNVRVYAPIASMLVISVVLSVALAVFSRLR